MTLEVANKNDGQDLVLNNRNIHIFSYLVIFLFVCYMLSPVIYSWGWYANHEHIRYFQLIYFFKESFIHGNFYPRWIPDLYGGYGYPLFVFYQPTFFFFSLPFSILQCPPLLGMLLLLITIIFWGALGVYKIAYLLTQDRNASIIFTILYLFTPYIYQDLYIRGALSEMTALLLCPWPLYSLLKLYFIIKIKSDYRFTLIQLLIALVLFIPSHPSTTMFYIPIFVLLIIILGLHLKINRLMFLGLSYLTLFLAFFVTSPYWYVLKMMMPLVNLDEAIKGYYIASNHVVYPQQLFSLVWRTTGISTIGPNDGMVFSLGLLHFCCAVIGFYLSRKKIIFLFSFFAYIFLIFLMLPWSLWIWKNINIVKYVQFPWRILAVISTFQIVCMVGIYNFPKKIKEYRTSFLVILLCLCFLLNGKQISVYSIRYPNVDNIVEEGIQSVKNRLNTYTVKNEYFPRTALTYQIKKPRDKKSLIENGKKLSVFPLKENNKYKLQYKLVAKDKTDVIINQLYFPGWHVQLNDETISSLTLKENISPDGRLRFHIPKKGTYKLVAYYKAPPGQNMLFLASFFMLFMFVSFLFLKKHRFYMVI